MDNKIQKTKVVEVEDFSGKKFFKIRLFNVMEGLDFFDKVFNSAQNVIGDKKFSIKEYIADLIPLVVPLDANGTSVAWPEGSPYTIDAAQAAFENPAAIIDLCVEVLKFQSVFIERSKTFRPLIETAKKAYPSIFTASETK